ncbi:hypothetical protein [Gracilimonas amylolytica]|uniref:hypothetical protein n=1 Tax=Gracilimonas amylolytica TaxID=1749045 RepID=UPI000CD97CFD|nr:hypothetical protein [Gracilimonas amylolytica]
MDPLKIEGLYEKAKIDLSVSDSERIQLDIIYSFIQKLEGHFEKFDSYLIQLFEELPELNHSLLFTGIDPEYLDQVIKSIELVVAGIPELRNDAKVRKKLEHIRDGRKQINSWLGLSSDDGNGSRLVLRSDPKTEINAVRKDVSEVYIPVLERSGNTGSFGRLRKIQVEVIGESRSREYELRPTFGVIGARSANLVKEAATAAGNFLKESISSPHYWTGTANFELGHAWHAGRSANAALAASFYCEMLRAENKREYFGLNPGIAITGDVDEFGTVLEVDEKSLNKKIEAAFYSWIQILVVPIGQLEEASVQVEKLQAKYPERKLIIKGIGHIKDLFYDRRLTFHHKTSLPRHAAQEIWKRKSSAAFITIMIVLLLVISGLLYGPIDKNPSLVELEGHFMVLKNEQGAVIDKIDVGEEFVRYHEEKGSYSYLYQLLDIDEDGVNEVIWAERSRSTNREKLVVKAWSVNQDKAIWEKELSSEFSFKEQPEILDGTMVPLEMVSINVNGENRIYLHASATLFFPNMIYTLNAATGEMLDEYLHTGRILDMAAVDLDEDGTEELVYTGVNNAFWSAFIGVLDANKTGGQSPHTEAYKADNFDPAEERYYALIPKTVVGEFYSKVEKYTYARRLLIDQEKQLISVQVSETRRSIRDDFVSAYIIPTFNYDMKLVGVGTSDLYDIIAKELFEEGHIPFIPDNEYFEEFSDSLVYQGRDSI